MLTQVYIIFIYIWIAACMEGDCFIMVFEIIKISKILDDVIDYDRIIFKSIAADVLDLDNAESLWIILMVLINGGARKIILDMQGLDFIDSSGIGIIIKTAQLVRSKKGEICLIKVPPRIDTIFKPVGLNRFIKMFDTEEKGVNYLKLF
jgi:anti-sigma B factor antagonist